MNNLELMTGKDYYITKKLKIKHPKLNDIIDLGEDKYNQYISALTTTSLQMADILYYDFKIWYEDITDWSLFISNFFAECKDSCKDKVIHDALEYFTGLKFHIAVNEKTNETFLKADNNVIINELNYKLISQFLTKINFIQEDELFYQLKNAGSKGTAKYILKQISKKRKRKNNGTNLQSIVSSLLWKSGVGKEIFDFPIFVIYEGFSRLSTIDNWDKTVTAYYAGTINTEKSPINLDKINWSKNLVK